MRLKQSLNRRSTWASIFWLTATAVPFAVSFWYANNKVYTAVSMAAFLALLWLMVLAIRLRQGMVTFGENGDRGFLYIGRDFMRNYSACVQIGWGFRRDAAQGEMQWRRYLCVAWNWTPVVRYQVGRWFDYPVAIEYWPHQVTYTRP